MKNIVKPKILYIPCGTINDLGKYLGLSSNYKKTFEVLKQDIVKMDIGKVNESYFSYVLGCGKFTSSSFGDKTGNKIGRFYYYFKALKSLFKKEYIEDDLILFLILNIWRVGGFQFKRKHKLNDGTMDVVLFSNSTFFILIFLFLRIIVKRYVKVERIEKITLKFKEKIKFNADGEESYFTDTLKINVIKEAICIYVDKKVKQKYF